MTHVAGNVGLYNLKVVSLWVCYFKTGRLVYDSLPVIILGAVGVLGSEPTLSSSLSPEEDEDKASREGFLEAEEAEILLEECFAM